MDPVSIIAAVTSLTFTCAKVIKGFQTVWATYRNAPATVISMITECATISAALSQIQILVLKDPVALSSRATPMNALDTNFDDALTGCMITLSLIEDEVERVGKAGFKAKAKFVWNEDTLAALLDQIRRQHHALSLLVVVLQT